MITDPFQLIVIFFGVILVSILLNENFKFAKKLSPVILILFIGALLSNTGLITDSSPFYPTLIGLAVPFAVCLVLFRVRMSDLKKAGLPLLVAFLIACLGTFMGVLVAGQLLEPYLYDVMGNESWKLAGPFTGTYVGGSLNFFALWHGLKIEDPDLFAAANAVDNLTLFPLFLFWIIVPDLLRRFYPVAKTWRRFEPAEDEEVLVEKPASLKILHIVFLTFAALAIMLVSGLITEWLISPYLPDFPVILLVTTFALILAQFKFIANLEGAKELGNLSFYLFFCAVGAMINIMKAVLLSPILFVYVLIIMITHFLVTYGMGRIFRLDINVLSIASAAAKTGPPTVLALANVKGWKSLALPGVAMGLLGYAIGNYVGFGAAYLMKFLLSF